MNIKKIDENELLVFLEFLLDKVEPCYYDEVKKSINNFLKRNGFKNLF